MDNRKDNNYYIQKIITDLEFVFNHTKNLTAKELEENEVLIDSMLFRPIQVAENSDKLTEDFKIQNNVIPWRAMKGMRNKIVHDYGNVDMSIVYNTVKKDIPDLLKELKKL